MSIQQQLDSVKTIEERRCLGQFSTPYELAKEIIVFGLDLLDGESPVSFFDPAFGTGVFYSALLDAIGSERIARAKGIEIDPHYGVPSQILWAGQNIDVQISDFTREKPDQKYNFVICNPPYVRHHLINSMDKARIREKTINDCGYRLSGLAGLYCHFLLQSYQWMEDGGIAGWLIPSEFMDVNYGREVKQFLLHHVELLRVHRFDPHDVQFEDALVSSAVVWFRKLQPSEPYSVEFSFGGTLLHPAIIREVNSRVLSNEAKWTRFPSLSSREPKRSIPRLSDYFSVKRGIATGNNGFFILPKSKIFELNLPFEFFRPVFPSARYVHDTEVHADSNGNPKLPQELFLLDCRLPEEEIREFYPTLWAYLEQGRWTVANGYLCKSRKCWYFQEQREAPPYICTYMGREKAEKKGAFRFILNHSKAVVTNSYLALYPLPTLSEEMKHKPELKQIILKLLNSLSPEVIIGEGRTYGGGLMKIEPAELLNVPVPEMEKILSNAKNSD
jgi:hypothetical protein